MAISIEHFVHMAEKGVRQRDYIFKGNLLDYAAYNFPDNLTYRINEAEDMMERSRFASCMRNVYEANSIGTDDRQTPLPFGDVEYIGTVNEQIFFNTILTKEDTMEELTFAVSHEIAHNLCYHNELLMELGKIHQELDVAFGTKDTKFMNVLERAFEYESDAVGLYLYRQTGGNPLVYRSEIVKFSFLAKEDMDENYLAATHASSVDRIAFLDSIDFDKFKFSIEDYRNRLAKIKSAKTIEEKLEIESFYYRKLMEMFSFESKGIQERIIQLESLPKERKFQYSRALETLKTINKNLLSESKTMPNALSYRTQANNVFLKNLLLIEKGQQHIEKSLSTFTKAKLVARSIVNKTKKEITEWQR